LRLVTHGVSQKVLAAKMDMAPSTFSKWVNQKAGISPASTVALDGFHAYVQELLEALAWDPADPNRHTQASGSHTPSAPAARSRPIPDGSALAKRGGQTDHVSGAAHSTDRGVHVDLERLAG
jgi:hypothetical protein